jgi:hypothetical protein
LGALAEDAMDCGTGDEMSLRQLAQTLPALAAEQDGVAIENERLPSYVSAF